MLNPVAVVEHGFSDSDHTHTLFALEMISHVPDVSLI